MSLSSIISRVVPVAVAAVTGGPIAATTTALATEKNLEAQARAKRANNAQRNREITLMQQMYPGNFDPVTGNFSSAPSTANAGNTGGFFDTASSFFRNTGRLVSDAFSSGIPQLFGVGRPQGVGQQPAVTTVTNVGARESQGSGTIQAGYGSFLAPLASTARNLLKSPIGQTALGGGAGFGLSMLGSDGRTMRVTRKMKAQARSLLNMTGGNLSVTADFLGISEEQLVAILLKRFRNDGPVVTKAALRKTRSTIRKMKSMCDMYDDLRPTARRRSPMRKARTTTTLIKN